MATYIVMLRFTEQGIKTVTEGPIRVEAAKQLCRSQGAEVKSYYLVMGQYDAVVILEAPDDQTVAEIGLALGVLGNVRTETLRAFTEDEYRKIIAKLP
ncbi:MAG TPA: GYD domain-containing protein [Nitrospirales bacterium]|jgi:uncharacterized protein with GYD domain|nr:GYD domain-containing protein [Nitrospirales bacterium]HIA13511.1 GYD domain-containing protein [Nitrospirales bacterium]HIB55333.1 GYD domain-containing protein [Nitrospirales bacterium]HIC04839.1 GYD domain-containing protein [Nitrospirales bacterium]HIN33019.1 GYD domain-containing protein [Nitrospirales bacterium]